MRRLYLIFMRVASIDEALILAAKALNACVQVFQAQSAPQGIRWLQNWRWKWLRKAAAILNVVDVDDLLFFQVDADLQIIKLFLSGSLFCGRHAPRGNSCHC